MKADEVLRLYAAGERNFSRVNLKGQSFKGKNLSGADFTGANIRGANFTKTNLKGTNFSGAKAGLQPQWATTLVIVSLLLSALSGLITAWTGIDAGSLLIHNDPIYLLAGEITIIIVFTVFLFVTLRQDLRAALGVMVGAVIGAGVLAVALAVALAVTGVLDEALAGSMTGAGALGGVLGGAGTMTGVLAGVLAVALTGTIAGTLPGTRTMATSLAVALIMAMAGTVVGAGAMTGTLAVALAGDLAVAGTTTMLGGYVARRALAGDEKFGLIRRLAVTFAATGGTSFRGTDLTDADFTKATLKNTNLSNAILNRTCWFRAQKLDWARVGGTILVDSTVQNLVVTGNGKNKSFVGLSFEGANLAEADLSDADLTEAELSGATLQGACLEGANLTKTQVIGTNFNRAKLTSACLEAWNIDSTTQLDGAICDYVYLLNNQRERRPSSGEFAPSEFTKLFQEVLSTVDLILRNGIDWEAFTYSFKKLQVENEDIELSIRSIENKGDGVVVVKVNVPADANKAQIHSDFTQSHEFALKAIEARYQAELKSKDEQIAICRRQTDLQLKVLENKLDNILELGAPAEIRSVGSKLVFLSVREDDFKQGFPVTLQIGPEGTLPFSVVAGRLPPSPEILERYNRWQTTYRRGLTTYLRIKVSATQVTNFSNLEFIRECNELAESLRKNLDSWLNSQSFRLIKERLLERLTVAESIRMILLTDNLQLRRLPWHLWDFFERYPKAEIALSAPVYERVGKSVPRAKVRILAILGNSTGIDIQKDREMLEQLPNAEVNFLVEPQLKELTDQLWEQGWDILFFAGHSSSQANSEAGRIYINQTDSLTIQQLKYALKKGIERGLKLAIFNSCDGLGLAYNLAELSIPQLIVMREPVPDQVAQEFLKNFLTAFTGGKSLYLSVREAREKLQGLEDEFPCATWLPVICQNPAEVPKTWQEFRGV